MKRKRSTRIDIEFGSRSESIDFFRRFGFTNIVAALEEAERNDANKPPAAVELPPLLDVATDGQEEL